MKYLRFLLFFFTIFLLCFTLFSLKTATQVYAKACSASDDRNNGCQCNQNNKCLSTTCSAGTCVGRANGQPCNENGKCASGYCQSPNNGGICANPPPPNPCAADRQRPDGCSCNEDQKCASRHCRSPNDGGTCSTPNPPTPVPAPFSAPPKSSALCQIPPTDVMFVIDTSSSMKGGDLNRAVRFVETLTMITEQSEYEKRYMGNVPFRIGLASFDSNGKILHPLTYDYQAIKDKVLSQWADPNGGTCLECALDNPRNENDALGAFKNAPANTRKIVIILTDSNLTRYMDEDGNIKGDATNQQRNKAEDNAYQSARRLSSYFGQAVQYFVVSYGSGDNDGFLSRIVNELASPLYGPGRLMNENYIPLTLAYREAAHIIRGGYIYTGAYSTGSSSYPYYNWNIQLSCSTGGQITQTNGAGYHIFTNLADSTSYRLNIPAKTGFLPFFTDTGQYQPGRDSTRSLTINNANAIENEYFYFAPAKSIAGCVFTDLDGDNVMDPGETYNGNASVQSSPNTGTFANTTPGCFTFTNFSPATTTYTIRSFTEPPGYRPTFPNVLNSYEVTYDAFGNCTVSPRNSQGQPSCSNGYITDLNFGITNASPWIQTSDSSIRNDLTSITNLIPSSATNRCEPVMIRDGVGGPGVLYSGSNPITLLPAEISRRNWRVQGEDTVYGNPIIRMSYDILLKTLTNSGERIETLPCKTDACSMTNTAFTYTDGSGPQTRDIRDSIYRWEGNATFGGINLTDKKIILLVDGDITITAPIQVSPGAILIMAATGNITVAPQVGSALNDYTCAGGSTVPQIQGIFSANENFIVAGDPANPDKQLHIAGNIITNASKTENGRLVNDRNLGTPDTQYPALTIRPRLDFALNVPEFLLRPSTRWEEVAP